jgi:hypothetical protein
VALSEIVAEVATFIITPLHAAARSEALQGAWVPPGPWKPPS